MCPSCDQVPSTPQRHPQKQVLLSPSYTLYPGCSVPETKSRADPVGLERTSLGVPSHACRNADFFQVTGPHKLDSGVILHTISSLPHTSRSRFLELHRQWDHRSQAHGSHSLSHQLVKCRNVRLSHRTYGPWTTSRATHFCVGTEGR